jgi:hypothetical protein
MLAHPSMDGEFTSGDDPGSDSISARADQSPKDGIARALAVIPQRPAAQATRRSPREVMFRMTSLAQLQMTERA